MNSLIRVTILLVLVLLGAGSLFAQALEPVGGPYTPDSATVLLLHFDGNLRNAAAETGLTDTAAVTHTTNPAKVYFIDNTTLSGMGQCVRLDNSAITDSTYLTVADTAALDLTGNWTIEAWANIFTFGDNAQDYRWVPRVVMKPGVDVFWHPNYWLEMWGDNRLFHAGYYTPGDAFISLTSENNMFVPGQWVHLTFIRDTTRGIVVQMVHDANKKLLSFSTRGFNPAVDVPNTNTNPVHIGWAGALVNADPSTDSWLDGFVDEIRISNVVRNFAGPPVITNVTQLPNQPTTAAQYGVSAKVQAFNPGATITKTMLHYYITSWDSVQMNASGIDYSASIPAQPYGTKIQYYVTAEDNNGLRSVFPLTAEAAQNPSYHQFYIFQPNVMLLHLTFEEGPGNPPVDHSPSNLPVISHPFMAYSTDAKEGTYSMEVKNLNTNGTVVDTNWVEVESPFLAAEEFSVDFWMKADSALHATRIIHYPQAAGDWNNNNYELSLRNNAKGVGITARYLAPARGALVALQDTAAIVLGKWYHVIYERDKASNVVALQVRDENDVVTYFQAKVDSSPVMGASVTPATLRIGRGYYLDTDYWYIAPYRGLLDNVQIHNYAKNGITAVENTPNGEPGLPYVFALGQNYPNPFNPTTRIEYTIPKAGQVSLQVFDILGRKVATLVNDVRHAGTHRIQWHGTNDRGMSVASGVYIYQLSSGGLQKVQKMMLMR
jgi:hypothetical protein